MAFLADNMQLSEKQVIQMQGQGLDLPTIQKLAQQKGYTMPRRQDLLQKTGDIVNRIFPGGKLGQALGTQAGLGITKIQDAIKGTNNAQFYDRSQPNNFRIAADVAQAGLTAYGAAAPIAKTVLGKAAQFGTLGAGSGFTSSIAEGDSIAKASGNAVRQGVIGGLLGASFGVLEKGVRGIGKGIGKTGEKIQYSVIKPSQADVKDGFSIETIKKYNLGGSLKNTLEKTDSNLDNLTKELNTKLAQNKTPVDLNGVYERTIKRIFGDKFTGFGSNTQLSTAAEKLREELTYTAGPNGIVTIPEAQVVKRAAGHYGSWQYGMTNPEAKASERVYNIFYNELKKEIENVSPEGVRGINKQISELIPVMNAVIRRIPVAERNGVLSLTDIISLTGGMLEPRALSLSVINLASKSGKVGAFLSKGTQAGQAVSRGIGAVEQTAKTLFPGTR